MEKQLTIPTPDGKTIYGKLRGDLSQPVVVFVHGLTGHMDEHLWYNGARFFEEHGYATYRFNQYDGEASARRLHETTIAQQATDLSSVLAYLHAHGAKQLFPMGHSYGGPTILKADQSQMTAAVLLDPTMRGTFHDYTALVPDSPTHVLIWSMNIVIGEAMYEENTTLNSPEWIKDFHKPTQVVVCGQGSGSIWPGADQTWRESLPAGGEVTVLPDADHSFTIDGSLEQMFEKTLAFLQKQTKKAVRP